MFSCVQMVPSPETFTVGPNLFPQTFLSIFYGVNWWYSIITVYLWMLTKHHWVAAVFVCAHCIPVYSSGCRKKKRFWQLHIIIVVLATKADGVIITGSGNQSPGPGQSAPNSVVSGNGTTLVLNSAATSPATSPTITSQQAAIGGVNGSLSSASCPPHVTSTLATLPPNPRPPPPLPPRRPREHPLMDSNPPLQVTYMLVSDWKSYLIQSLGFCRALSDQCSTLLSFYKLWNLWTSQVFHVFGIWHSVVG